MLKLYHARGVFQSSVSWVTIDGARESCGDVWVNRVRLASDCASTDCWRRSCPVSCCNSGVNPRKRSEHSSMLPLRLYPPGPRAHISPSKRQMAKQKGSCLLPSSKSASPLLSSKVRQPTAISARAVGVGYRDQCLDQQTCGFQLLLFFTTLYDWLHF